MDENLLVIRHCSITFSWVFFASMEEKSSAYSLSYLAEIFALHMRATGNDRKFESLHDEKQLLSDVQSSLHSSCLYEVLIAPSVLISILLPSFVNS
jgi:hypothetical protein